MHADTATVLEALLHHVRARLRALEITPEYLATHNPSERTLARWEGEAAAYGDFERLLLGLLSEMGEHP